MEEQEKSGGPQLFPVPGQQPRKGQRQASDEPIIGGHGKPSRAARREANRRAKLLADTEAAAGVQGREIDLAAQLGRAEKLAGPKLAPLDGFASIAVGRETHK